MRLGKLIKKLIWYYIKYGDVEVRTLKQIPTSHGSMLGMNRPVSTVKMFKDKWFKYLIIN